MLRTRLAAILVATAIMVPPAAALAGSAGDNQYQDPFGNTPQQAKPKTKPKSTPQVSGNSQTSSPSASAPAQSSTQTAPAAASAQPAAASGQQLPRTGVDVRLLAGAGVVLLVAGLALRRLA